MMSYDDDNDDDDDDDDNNNNNLSRFRVLLSMTRTIFHSAHTSTLKGAYNA